MDQTGTNGEYPWQQYEKQIFEICKSHYPGCKIIFDHKVKGLFSESLRQIDVAIEYEVEGERLLGVIECKYWKKKVSVSTIDSFLGFLKDINADFGYLITNQGFSKGAKNRVSLSDNILLQIVEFEEFRKQGIEVDDIINHVIRSLVFIKPLFLIRIKSWSNFINSERTSFEEKTIAFKDRIINGKVSRYCNTEYYVFKKLMEGTARGFRDFPAIKTLRLIIPHAHTNQEYFSKIDIQDFEAFLGVSFQELKRDIKTWRNFLESIKKPDVLNFKQKYVQSKPIDSEDWQTFT